MAIRVIQNRPRKGTTMSVAVAYAHIEKVEGEPAHLGLNA